MIRLELHCHTYHSEDSLMTPGQILEVCDKRGIDRVAITDHNTIAGALQAADLAPERVIVGEEIMTTRGELLAYFVSEEVPPGLSPEETIGRLRQQGAVISVSHPFDRMRKGAWDPPSLLAILPLVDALETFNARTWSPGPNRLAAAWAAEHGLLATAGSDAHMPGEIGRATVALPEFSGPEAFLESLKEGRIDTRRSAPWVHLFSRYAVWRKRMGWAPPMAGAGPNLPNRPR